MFQKKTKVLKFAFGFSMCGNVLRVGDVALCCPETSGRQGNIAYTLLGAGCSISSNSNLLTPC